MYKVCVMRKRFFWYVTLVSANNGQVLMTSETYLNKGNANRIAKKIGEASGFEVVTK